MPARSGMRQPRPVAPSAAAPGRGARASQGDPRTARSDVRRAGAERRPSARSQQHQSRTHAPHDEGFIRGLQKKFRSAKAERAFDRTIGARERSQDAEQTSRAAVYDMRMGQSQRRSARLQASDKDKGAFGFSLPFSLPGSLSLSMRAARALAVVMVLAFTVFTLYPPCASYYNETRQLQQLQAEYDELSSYNQETQSRIDYLNTDAGIEDYARSELGWIRSDEQMATVEGVEPSDTTATSGGTIRYPAASSSIKAPDTWYSGILDVVFGYAR